MYDRYRRRKLSSELEALAETMESTILQQDLARALFEKTVETDTAAKSAVADAIALLREGNYDQVDDSLETLKLQIQDEETRVSNEIQKLRLSRLEKVTAMRQLNERVERVNPAKIEALERLLDEWNWQAEVSADSSATLEERRMEAAEYGSDMATIYDELTETLFGPYRETNLWPLVESLLDEQKLTLGELTEEERERLATSDLADHLEVSLS